MRNHKIIVAIIAAGATLIPALTKIYFDHRKIADLQNQIIGIHGDFEWQWAGEGWKGMVTISNNSYGRRIAKIDMQKWCNGKVRGPLIDSTSEGTVDAYENGFVLHLPVKRYLYDANCQLSGTVESTLSANLNRVEAYAGLVEYKDTSGTSHGDMVLVAYSSGIKEPR